MAKQTEIIFRRAGRNVVKGRKNNVIFYICEAKGGGAAVGEKKFYVSAYAAEGDERGASTVGHEYFTLDGAKAFCQQIAAGEIDLEDLRAFYDAEDARKEQEAVLAMTEKAKKFHERLEAVGISYHDLLELEVLAHSLGDIGHNILLGYERGEGWPNGN
jgi:hypothetical protein